MPVDRRKRTVRHAQVTRPVNRAFAVQQKEHVEVGAAGETSANEILASLYAAERETRPAPTKKEKQQMRHEALMQRLGISGTPYSKSTMRRIKRKEKEKLSVDLTAVGEAMAAVEAQAASSRDNIQKDDKLQYNNSRPKPGQIGEGRPTSLTSHQRRNTLKAESLRHKHIMEDPNFSSNPFKTLRTHAENTLIKH